MLDHILFGLELLLLAWIVVQGEQVKFYERETWKINKERYDERAKWRLAKQKTALTKLEKTILPSYTEQKTDSSENITARVVEK